MTSRSTILSLAVVVALLLSPATYAQPQFIVETIDPGGFVGSYISVAVDNNGRPHVVYWDVSNFWLVYATRTNGGWQTEIVEATGFAGNETSIAVDADGVPHVSYHNFTLTSQELRYAVRSGGSWTVEVVEATANDVGRFNAIAIDAQGNPHIAYHDVTNGDLRYAVKNGGWSTEAVDVTSGAGMYNDLVLDGAGQPHISYVDDEPDLFYTHKVGGTWYKEMASGATSLSPTAIDVDAAGNPTIIHQNATFLNIVQRNGAFWSSVGIDNGIGFDGAFELDADGRPQILYQLLASGLNDLWYTGEADTGWVFAPVIENGTAISLAQYADLAIDPHGNLVGAFNDATHGDAMFVDSGVRLTTALSGVTWPVGSERTVTWRGVGAVDLLLSGDGGATFEPLATGLTGGDEIGGGSYTLTVPHKPSRFSKIRIERQQPYSASESDSLFTIETSVSLLNLVFSVPDEGSGYLISWRTDPGPDDIAGYRIDRRRSENWVVIEPLTEKEHYHDVDGRPGDRYRLYAVNRLGEELLLATDGPGTPSPPATLSMYPNPFSTGELQVRFATAGGLGGGASPATVRVYNVRGALVATLVDRLLPAGSHQTSWDGRNRSGALVTAGVYFVRASSAGFVTSQKLTIVR